MRVDNNRAEGCVFGARVATLVSDLMSLVRGATMGFVVLVSVALAGCQKPSFEVGTIDFGTDVRTESTRASIDEQSDLCEACSTGGERIGIVGTVTDALNPTPVEIFSNTPLYYTGSDWTYDNVRYWVRDAHHEFLAIYPYSSTAYTWDAVAGTLSYENITLGTSNNTDVLYATAERNLAQSADTTTPVKLELHHAFALLEFWFVNASQYVVTNVRDIALENLLYKGSLNLSTDGSATLDVADDRVGVTSGVYVGNLTITDMPVDLSVCYNLFDNVGEVGSSEFDSVAQITRKNGGAVLVMPQMIEGAGVKFKLRISDSATLSEFDLSNMSSVREWRAGYKYIYTLTLTTNEITCDVKVLDWIHDEVELM